jgi:kumamolisin
MGRGRTDEVSPKRARTWRGTTLRVGAAVAIIGSASAVALSQGGGVSATSTPTTTASLASSPGTLIGPSHAKSVSFIALLHTAAAPTCLTKWASGKNLSVQWSAGQNWVSISGAAGAVDRGFHVTINDYRANGKVIYAANHPAAVPSPVCGEVAGVGAIHSFVQPVLTNVDDVRPGGASASDLLRAYDALPLTQNGINGQGETVVFLELGGFLASDFTKFATAENLPSYNITLIGQNTGFDDETTMDMETVHEIAPQAHLVYDNINSISNASSDADIFVQAITQAAKQFPGSIFSASLGICESDTSAFNNSDLQALNSAIMSVEASGSTVFASSGDTGGLDCTPPADDGQPPQSSFVGVSVPASLPAVTGTGGTALSTDSSGNYVGETSWSEPLLSQGSGGGVSVMSARPSWQTGQGTGGQLDQGNGRQVPDVSADSDPATGNFIVENGDEEQGGGTSLAAPLWAGFTALMDQYLKANHDPPVGFFNPILYKLASSSQFRPFHDVTEGGNDLYPATPGYDMVTGLGSPDVYNLARDLKAGKF